MDWPVGRRNERSGFSWIIVTAIVAICAVAVVLAVFLYTSNHDTSPGTGENGATLEDTSNVAAASNWFALDFYSKLRGEEGNIFFSPYSISAALAMVYEGACGKTAEEIQSVFHFPEEDETRRAAFATIYNQLNKESAEYELHTANALWTQKEYVFKDEYLDVVERYYFGEATNLDFAGAVEDARRTINDWVEDETNNKIKNLFPQGSLNPLTRLVLTNAIYFKGVWVKQFDEKETRQEEFKLNPDNTAQVPMMKRTDEGAKFNYTETEELQLLEMLYEGEELSMLVLLPKGDDLQPLEEILTLENLNWWRSQLQEQRVDVFIPKFTFTSKYFLNENLREMGMSSAFAPGADFSGIDGTKDLFIQTVIHQAFVDVNEEGTEAAAATGVGVGITSVLPSHPVFRADHPFIFVIQHRETGNVLFLGRVADPR